MTVATEVMVKGPPKFDMCGQFKGYPLTVNMNDVISPGLVRRLVQWASQQMESAGFPIFDRVLVSTTDGAERTSHRMYRVTFTNEKGGSIGVQGILTRNGWPFVDHGFFIEP
jgi:hypothetical protein